MLVYDESDNQVNIPVENVVNKSVLAYVVPNGKFPKGCSNGSRSVEGSPTPNNLGDTAFFIFPSSDPGPAGPPPSLTKVRAGRELHFFMTNHKKSAILLGTIWS